MRATAIHKCGWLSIPVRCRIWVEFVVASRLVLRVFIRVLRFPSSTKKQHSKFQFNQDRAPAWADVASSFYIVMYFNLFLSLLISLCRGDNAKFALNSAGSNSSLEKGNNDASCNCGTLSTALANGTRYSKEMNQYLLGVYHLAYCLCHMDSMPTHKGAWSCFMTLAHYLECAGRLLHFSSFPF